MQTSVESELQKARAGGIVGLQDSEIVSKINNAKQRSIVTITAADLTTEVTINGTLFTVNSPPVAQTKAQLAAALIAEINGGSEPVTASLVGTEQVAVESNTSGVSFTIVGTTNTTVAADILNETAVEFGLIVVQDTSDSSRNDLAHLPSLSTEITDGRTVIGMAMAKVTQESNLNAANVGYPTQSQMSILRSGQGWVQVEDPASIVLTQQIFVRFSATGQQKRGIGRSDADTATAAALPGSAVRDIDVANNLALVEINLPQ
jgi:hypothetical protein